MPKTTRRPHLKAARTHSHQPALLPLPAENAERELKAAYNAAMEMGTVWLWARPATPFTQTLPLQPEAGFRVYRTAAALYRNQFRPASEHWARACSHLCTALWHEAKLAWLNSPGCPRDLLELPHGEFEFHLHESPVETRDLLDDLMSRPHLPPPSPGTPGIYAYEWIQPILKRAREHLTPISPLIGGSLPLRMCEAIQAAEEWARCAEELMAVLGAQQSSEAPPVSA